MLADPNQSSGGNDVWSVISKGVSDYFSYQTAKVRTQAAPSGAVVYTNSANPFPGTQGAYPQAEAKPAPGGAGFLSGSSIFGGGAVALIVGLILVALLVRR